MQEEIMIVLIKADDMYIEVFSGSEEELSSIRESIKDVLENKEVKEIKLNKEEYIASKDNMKKLQELYSR